MQLLLYSLKTCLSHLLLLLLLLLLIFLFSIYSLYTFLCTFSTNFLNILHCFLPIRFNFASFILCKRRRSFSQRLCGQLYSFYVMFLYRVSQEEWTKLRESVSYVKIYWYNPKHLYPKLNGYGDNGQRSLKVWQLLHTYWLPNSY